MKIEEIKELMKAMEESEITSFDFSEGNIRLSLRRGEPLSSEFIMQQSSKASKPIDAEAGENAAVNVRNAFDGVKDGEVHFDAGSNDAENKAEASKPDKVIFSPLVGTFYSSPSPEEEPYIAEGSEIKKGQVIGIIEAMKLMNELESEYDGRVEAVLVENGQTVEYGQPLFRIS